MAAKQQCSFASSSFISSLPAPAHGALTPCAANRNKPALLGLYTVPGLCRERSGFNHETTHLLYLARRRPLALYTGHAGQGSEARRVGQGCVSHVYICGAPHPYTQTNT